MTMDPEMERWRNDWSQTAEVTSPPNANAIIAAARRHHRRSQVGLAANIVFGLLLIGGSLWLALRMHSREIVLWAVVVWIATIIATLLAVEGWRKSKIDNIESVATFEALHRKKAIADQWKVRTGVIFLIALLSVGLGWFTADLFAGRIPPHRYVLALVVQLVLASFWSGVFAYIWKRAAAVLNTAYENHE